MSEEITTGEAKKILEAPVKDLSFEEGFIKYKGYLNKPHSCSTTLKVKGYEARFLSGFKIESEDPTFQLTEKILKEKYQNFLEGKIGSLDF